MADGTWESDLVEERSEAMSGTRINRTGGIAGGALAALAALGVGAMTLGAAAQQGAPADASGGALPGRAKLAVLDIRATDALRKTLEAEGGGKERSLDRVTQAADGQLLDRFHNTRKFELIARSDMGSLMDEQDFQSAFSADPAKAFGTVGADYGLVLTIDDFQDRKAMLQSEDGRVLSTKRTVRLSAVAKIYDVERGTLLETAGFALGPATIGAKSMEGATADTDDKYGELLTDLSRELSGLIAQRVLDVIYPAKIVVVRAGEVGLNRGDGTDIAADEEWVVYSVGEEIIDPDTGESLGSDEAEVGRIRITRVNEKMSFAEVLEDYGISVGAIARRAGSRLGR